MGAIKLSCLIFYHVLYFTTRASQPLPARLFRFLHEPRHENVIRTENETVAQKCNVASEIPNDAVLDEMGTSQVAQVLPG